MTARPVANRYRYEVTDLTVANGGAVTARYVLRVTGMPVATGGGVSDHGALTGLADDDHTQYAKKASNLSDLASISTALANLGLTPTHVAVPSDETATPLGTARFTVATIGQSSGQRGIAVLDLDAPDGSLCAVRGSSNTGLAPTIGYVTEPLPAVFDLFTGIASASYPLVINDSFEFTIDGSPVTFTLNDTFADAPAVLAGLGPLVAAIDGVATVVTNRFDPITGDTVQVGLATVSTGASSSIDCTDGATGDPFGWQAQSAAAGSAGVFVGPDRASFGSGDGDGVHPTIGNVGGYTHLHPDSQPQNLRNPLFVKVGAPGEGDWCTLSWAGQQRPENTPYTPAVSGDWPDPPTNQGQANDRLAARVADLEGASTAALPALRSPATTGDWVPLFRTAGTAQAVAPAGSTANSNGLVTYQPFPVYDTVSCAGLGIEVVAGNAGASAVIRLGVFATAAGRPGDILAQGTASAGAAVKEITWTPVSLTPGWYWAAVVFQDLDPAGTNPTLRYSTVGFSAPISAVPSGTMQNGALRTTGFTTGPFTDDPSVVYVATTVSYILWMKVG